MSVAFFENKYLSIAGRCAVPIMLLMLPACSYQGIGSYQGLGAGLNSGAGLGYQGPETSHVQSDMRSSLAEHVETSLTADKKYKVAKLKSKPSGPKFDPLAARDLINTYRIAKGLRPLMIHPQLTQAAQKHSKDLASQDKISHYGSDGSSPWDRVMKSGFKPRVAAENVGTGQMTVKEVFKGWKDSPSHDENLLLNDATHLGIAMVHQPNSRMKTFWTLVVGSPI